MIFNFVRLGVCSWTDDNLVLRAVHLQTGHHPTKQAHVAKQTEPPKHKLENQTPREPAATKPATTKPPPRLRTKYAA